MATWAGTHARTSGGPVLRRMVWTLFSAVTIAIAVTATTSSAIAMEPNAADVMGRIVIVDRQGHEHTLREFRGKAVFVNIWAQWCPPCRYEMRSLLRLRNRLRNEPIVFIELSDPPSWKNDLAWADENGFGELSYYVRRNPWGREANRLLWNINRPYQHGWVPTTFMLDRNGGLAFTKSFSAEWDSDEWISKILAVAHAEAGRAGVAKR